MTNQNQKYERVIPPITKGGTRQFKPNFSTTHLSVATNRPVVPQRRLRPFIRRPPVNFGLIPLRSSAEVHAAFLSHEIFKSGNSLPLTQTSNRGRDNMEPSISTQMSNVAPQGAATPSNDVDIVHLHPNSFYSSTRNSGRSVSQFNVRGDALLGASEAEEEFSTPGNASTPGQSYSTPGSKPHYLSLKELSSEQLRALMITFGLIEESHREMSRPRMISALMVRKSRNTPPVTRGGKTTGEKTPI